MIETFLTFMAFILAYFSFVKGIIIFRLNVGILSMRKLMWIFITLAIMALSQPLIQSSSLKKILSNDFLYDKAKIDKYSDERLKTLSPFVSDSLDWSTGQRSKKWSLEPDFSGLLDMPLKVSQSDKTSLFNLLKNVPSGTWNTNINSFINKIPYSVIGQIILFFWNAILVFIIIYLFSKIVYPVEFKKRNAKAYFEGCCYIIANGVESDIQQLTSEIFYSIEKIFFTIFNSDISEKDMSEKEIYAYRLMALFSDEIFCKKIVTHNPATLYKIFETITKSVNATCIKRNITFIDRLLFFLFIEPNSHLHREEPYYGLGKFSTFKKLIFGNASFLKSEYRPLSSWIKFNYSDLSERTIKKYFEILKYSLKNYLENSDDYPDIFFSAFDSISDIIKDNIHNMKSYPVQSENEIQSTLFFKNLMACHFGLISIIHFIKTNKDLFPASNEINKSNYSYFQNDKNIYGAISYGLFEAIESLSMYYSGYESVRILLLEIYEFSRNSQNAPLVAIQERLNLLLEKKIEENLVHALYPAVTASLIYSLGLCEPDQATLSLHKALLINLKVKFTNAYNYNSEIALDMLPKDTEYIPSQKKLSRKHAFRWRRYKEVEELKLED